jgi:prepilin-type N-terminal cleavage/methylation domain-containing protein/prepilin-type processing-associated H-X9-DG protein
MKPSIHLDCLKRVPTVPAQTDQAFTLTELLVVLATLAVLALLLVPALAGTKIDSWRIQCQNNLKQLQVGFQEFSQDHNDMLPPAGWTSSIGSSQMAWDSWINKYIGGNLPDSDLDVGDAFESPSNQALSIEACPADTFPKVNFVGGNNPWFALRSYAMDASGQAYGTGVQVGDQNRTYPLPDLSKPGMQGVGIYWIDTTSSTSPDWDARGYKTSVVGDPAGTILLCENTHGQQTALNIWTCCCIGPQGSGNEMVQIDTTTNPTQNPTSSTSVNQGILLYQAHWKRFNYAFHDGHVAPLSVQQTVGTGTLTAPKGMWTVAAGD